MCIHYGENFKQEKMVSLGIFVGRSNVLFRDWKSSEATFWVTGVVLVSSRTKLQNFLADQRWRETKFFTACTKVKEYLEKHTLYIFFFYFSIQIPCVKIFRKILSFSRKIFFTVEKKKRFMRILSQNLIHTEEKYFSWKEISSSFKGTYENWNSIGVTPYNSFLSSRNSS